MLSDLNLEQQNNTNMQIRLLQMKHESDEVGFIFKINHFLFIIFRNVEM
jgi:hypothetical protein